MSFKQTSEYFETLRCLQRDAARPGTWLLSEPHLLYLVPVQAAAYLQAMQNRQYSSGFHDATLRIVEKMAPQIYAKQQQPLNLIDLGPGYPEKTLPIVRHLHPRGVPITYTPVDVSVSFLEIAASAMAPWVDAIQPYNCRFEELPLLLPAKSHVQSVRCCFIGITFMNFPHAHIVPLLQRIAGAGGHVMLASELITPTNRIEQILHHYNNDAAYEVAIGPLLHLGIARTSVRRALEFAMGRVEMGMRLIDAPPPHLAALGMRQGDRLVTVVSYRYTMGQLQSLLSVYYGSVECYPSADGATVLAVCK